MVRDSWVSCHTLIYQCEILYDSHPSEKKLKTTNAQLQK